MTNQKTLPTIVSQSSEFAFEQLELLASNDQLFRNMIATAFGESADASLFQSAWAKGDFSSFPPIEIRDSAEIGGANGAFSITTGKIYLAQEFINANVNNLDAIVAVLLEEYGHYVDSQINVTDSAGDEGDIFARLVQGKRINQSELAVLKAEDDTATVMLDGHFIEIEMNNTLTGGQGDDEIYGGEGDDTIDGDGLPSPLGDFAGNDTLYGEDGNDYINGRSRDDELYGGNGSDVLDGDTGSDHLSGGNGNDVIYGDIGSDHIYGDNGDDILYTGKIESEDSNLLNGGPGIDIFVVGLGFPNSGIDPNSAQQSINSIKEFIENKELELGIDLGVKLTKNVIGLIDPSGIVDFLFELVNFIKDLEGLTAGETGSWNQAVLIEDFTILDTLIFPTSISNLLEIETYYVDEEVTIDGKGRNGIGLIKQSGNQSSPFIFLEQNNRSYALEREPISESLTLGYFRQLTKEELVDASGYYPSSDGEDPDTEAPNRDYIIGAYFPEWGIYGRDFQVEDVPADKLTHLFYSFAQIDNNGEVAIFDPWAATDTPFFNAATGEAKYTYEQSQAHQAGNFAELQKLKAENPHLNLMLSIGGWSLSGPFSTVASTEASREKFAQSAVEFMVEYGFDGLDIDWEYPGGGPDINEVEKIAPTRLNKEVKNSPPNDKYNYTLLLAELDEQIEIQEATDGRDYQLSIASPAGSQNIENIELGEVSKYIDFFNLMAYDFHGSTWEPDKYTTNHQAALFANPNDPLGADAEKFSIHSAVEAYLDAGVDPQDIVLGAPLYGRAWSGVSNSTNGGLFQSATGTATGTWEPGVLDYDDLYNRLETQPESYTRYWDDEAKVPYIYSPTGFFSTYEDSESIGLKTNYIKNMGLGGMFFWDISSDLPSSHNDSLINTAYNSLILNASLPT